ncbi:MAG: hypothetical protein HY519_01150 [Candidatus Aenigmarchaeota archaeon]|nr:hypothetical protein [Candidatus Aenigmarchaeota archaeon]
MKLKEMTALQVLFLLIRNSFPRQMTLYLSINQPSLSLFDDRIITVGTPMQSGYDENMEQMLARLKSQCVLPKEVMKRMEERTGEEFAIICQKFCPEGISPAALVLLAELGLRMVIAQNFGTCRQDLVNFGILPLNPVHNFEIEEFGAERSSTDSITFHAVEQQLMMSDLGLADGVTLVFNHDGGAKELHFIHNLNQSQIEILLAGGLANWLGQQV